MNLEKALNRLRENDHKVTQRRKDMIKFFEQENRYINAKAVMNYMEELHPSMSFDTVYRNLHLYEQLNILEVTNLDGEKHFRMKCSSEHHHHFICNDCGATKKLPLCPMDEALDLLYGYDIEDHKFEVYGRCPDCQFVL